MNLNDCNTYSHYVVYVFVYFPVVKNWGDLLGLSGVSNFEPSTEFNVGSDMKIPMYCVSSQVYCVRSLFKCIYIYVYMYLHNQHPVLSNTPALLTAFY